MTNLPAWVNFRTWESVEPLPPIQMTELANTTEAVDREGGHTRDSVGCQQTGDPLNAQQIYDVAGQHSNALFVVIASSPEPKLVQQVRPYRVRVGELPGRNGERGYILA